MPRSSTPTRLRRADFEMIAEAIPHVVWMSSPDGSTDYFNTRGTDYTGLPRQANYGWEWVKLVHPDDADRARLGWEHATRTATPFDLSYRIRRSDGEFLWHTFRALPVCATDGEIVKWIGTADESEDVTDTTDHAARVDRQTQELRSLLTAVQPASERPDLVELVTTPEATQGTTDGLPPRELAVLRLVAAGYTNAEIANLLAISLRSVEWSRSRLRERFGLRSRAQLVRFAYESGFR